MADGRLDDPGRLERHGKATPDGVVADGDDDGIVRNADAFLERTQDRQTQWMLPGQRRIVVEIANRYFGGSVTAGGEKSVRNDPSLTAGADNENTHRI
jgi:hypothetical protein